MVSEEGLNAYGAVTWGQFFVYQGFNEHCGWMHTSSAVDAADTYIEKISKTGNKWVYEYDGKSKPVIQKRISIKTKKETGIETTTINALFTQHGPIMAKRNGQWLSIRADNRIMNGLVQCWQRTKAKSLTILKRHLTSKEIFPTILYMLMQKETLLTGTAIVLPKEIQNYDWSKAVDGSVSATEWKGYHSIGETVFSVNPPNGWLQNCNSTPFTVAGANSPKKENYPAYMAPDWRKFSRH
jgi:acyl-homoserine lactone acylase PvdQ